MTAHPRIALILGTFLLVLATVFAVKLTLAALLPHAPPQVAMAMPPPKPKPPAPPPPVARDARDAERAVYRLDFVVTRLDAGGVGTIAQYAINVAENDNGEIRVTNNVPLSPAIPGAGLGGLGVAAPRVDIGLKIKCSLQPAGPGGSEILMHGDEEMSFAAPGSAIRKLAAQGDALLAPGRPALVTRMEDPSAHARYEVSVTATRVP
jgi:hypothetical protein